jgi:hypothetical protein
MTEELQQGGLHGHRNPCLSGQRGACRRFYAAPQPIPAIEATWCIRWSLAPFSAQEAS